MKNLLLAAVIALSSCRAFTEPTNTVQDAAFAPLYEIVDQRHDAWVTDDALLSVEDRDQALSESRSVRTVLAMPGSETPASELSAAFPVMDRHDAYVQRLILDRTDQADYLRSTDLLRDMLQQAHGQQP
jgi:hypothetical protein